MTPQQLQAEKHALQRTLLQFEKTHGKPVSRCKRRGRRKERGSGREGNGREGKGEGGGRKREKKGRGRREGEERERDNLVEIIVFWFFVSSELLSFVMNHLLTLNMLNCSLHHFTKFLYNPFKQLPTNHCTV